MAEPMADSDGAVAGDRQPPPWGLSFNFDPPRDESLSLRDQEEEAAANWGRIAWALPGWEVRPVPETPKAYLAFPPAELIQASPDRPDPEAAFHSRFTALRDVRSVSGESVERGASLEAIQRFLADAKVSDPPTDDVVRELRDVVGSDQLLAIAVHGWRKGDSRLTVLERLLGAEDGAAKSNGLRQRSFALTPQLRGFLRALRKLETDKFRGAHLGVLTPRVSVDLPARSEEQARSVADLPPPFFRELRAYSYDPSLTTDLDTAPIDSVKIPVRWEECLEPGPIGEYLEVIDVDPSSQCVYTPVDLNHPYLLANDGMLPSEGDPRFHQQMVYAVAMNTIHRFELALGRPVFWSALRPWLTDPLHSQEQRFFTSEARRLLRRPPAAPTMGTDTQRFWNDRRQTRYVQRLRIYPHALREDNAYYSPAARALLFGYFPNIDASRRDYPGGMVFTCLSHDIVAHETTHALVDGMHPYFSERTNRDVLAFHEAFADIVALFQHFTYPEVVRDQIARSGGSLETANLLGQLAQQFGKAQGERGALRDYLMAEEPDKDGNPIRKKPDPFALEKMEKPHKRGSILVSAVFDAFIALYNTRVNDILRIATGGSGILPAGQIHPDLARRLANEAAETAKEVLAICIRALDYLPPVDVTFGEFLRALVTADYDRSPTGREERSNRIAFIDAFRSWGIYPADVTTLSEASLRWRGPESDSPLQRRLDRVVKSRAGRGPTAARLVEALDLWQPGCPRDEIFDAILAAQAAFHGLLRETQGSGHVDVIPGLDWRTNARFNVGNLRPARRIGPQGEFRTEMVVEVVQRYRPRDDESAGPVPRRGGATLIIDLRTFEVRYIIYKRLYRATEWPEVPNGPGGHLANRFDPATTGAPDEAQAMWMGEEDADLPRWLSGTYGGVSRKPAEAEKEPFAFLHRGL